MALDDADLAIVRSWCGSDVGAPGDQYDTVDIEARLERLGTAEQVALELLRARRADMVMSPAKIDVDGDFSQDATESIKALDRQILALEAVVARAAGEGATTTSLMVRRTGR